MARPLSPVFRLPEGSGLGLRDQVVQVISAAIAANALPADLALPSCRELSAQMGVSKNTVFGAYARLVEMGLLTVRDRSGYFLASGNAAVPSATHSLGTARLPQFSQPRPSSLDRVVHPANWQSYPYPFVYNQTDPSLFPLEAWRECSRQALGRRGLSDWTADDEGGDSPHLVQQLRQRLLLHRGIAAADDEVMITLGTQNALSLVGLLLRDAPGVVAVEDPGYPDARNAFAVTGNRLAAVPVDDQGLRVADIPAGCKLVYVTPSHQFPTSVTLSLGRRTALLSAAEAHDFLILEDDYEAEMDRVSAGPTLRSLDRTGRVIYTGSLSKTLSPGLRIGFMVAQAQIIREAKALRRAMLRHAPTALQETAALFLSLGFYDSHLRSFVRKHRARWREMRAAIDRHLPHLALGQSSGGSSFWLSGPETFDAAVLASRVLARGVILDPGRVFYMHADRGNAFRLGFGYIQPDRMEAGLRIVAEELRS